MVTTRPLPGGRSSDVELARVEEYKEHTISTISDDLQTVELGPSKLNSKVDENSGVPTLYSTQSVSSVASPTRWLFTKRKSFTDSPTAHREMWIKVRMNQDQKA